MWRNCVTTFSEKLSFCNDNISKRKPPLPSSYFQMLHNIHDSKQNLAQTNKHIFVIPQKCNIFSLHGYYIKTELKLMSLLFLSPTSDLHGLGRRTGRVGSAAEHDARAHFGPIGPGFGPKSGLDFRAGPKIGPWFSSSKLFSKNVLLFLRAGPCNFAPGRRALKFRRAGPSGPTQIAEMSCSGRQSTDPCFWETSRSKVSIFTAIFKRHLAIFILRRVGSARVRSGRRFTDPCRSLVPNSDVHAAFPTSF